MCLIWNPFNRLSRKVSSIMPMHLAYSCYLLHVRAWSLCIFPVTTPLQVVSAATRSTSRQCHWVVELFWNTLEAEKVQMFARCEWVLHPPDCCLEIGHWRYHSVFVGTIDCSPWFHFSLTSLYGSYTLQSSLMVGFCPCLLWWSLTSWSILLIQSCLSLTANGLLVIFSLQSDQSKVWWSKQCAWVGDCLCTDSRGAPFFVNCLQSSPYSKKKRFVFIICGN